MEEDDVTLLRLYAGENRQEAFAELVRRNMNAVYSAALRRLGGDAHLARDVAQEVFISLARHAHRVARREVLTGWLHTATRNAAANRVRSEVRRRIREQEAQAMHDIPGNQDGETHWPELAPVLDEALDGLPERDHTALLLRFFQQRSFAQMGTVLRISEDAARMRVERALERLRARLVRLGIQSSAAALGVAMTRHAVQAAPAGLAELASGAATAAPLTAGEHLAEFLASFRPREAGAVCASAAVLGLAIFLADSAGQAAEATRAARAEQDRAIQAAENRLEELPRPARARPAETGAPPVAPPRTRLAGGRRAELAATYDPFYRSLGLGAGEIRRFESIRTSGPADSALWLYEGMATEPSPGALSAEEMAHQLRALLGDRGYAQYEDFNRTMPARNAVVQMAGELYLTDPLAPEKAGRLAELFAAASPAYAAGGSIDLGRIDWELLQKSAGEMLSPAQMSALLALRRRVAFQEALRQRTTAFPGTTP